jgi:hypothetical protein
MGTCSGWLALLPLLALQVAAYHAQVRHNSAAPVVRRHHAAHLRRAGPLRTAPMVVRASLGEALAEGRPQRVVVLGGGVAGLAVSYHLLVCTRTYIQTRAHGCTGSRQKH